MPWRSWAAEALVVLSTICAATASAAPTISVGPYAVSTTSPFIVPVQISGAAGLSAFSFDLVYDATSFQINVACDPTTDPFCSYYGFFTGPVTPGDFFAASFAPVFDPGFILLNPSTFVQTGSLLGVSGNGDATTGDGILAYVEFITVPGSSSTTPITIGVAPSDAVPEPSTLALMAVALAPFALRRRKRRDAGGRVA